MKNFENRFIFLRCYVTTFLFCICLVTTSNSFAEIRLREVSIKAGDPNDWLNISLERDGMHTFRLAEPVWIKVDVGGEIRNVRKKRYYIHTADIIPWFAGGGKPTFSRESPKISLLPRGKPLVHSIAGTKHLQLTNEHFRLVLNALTQKCRRSPDPTRSSRFGFDVAVALRVGAGRRPRIGEFSVISGAVPHGPWGEVTYRTVSTNIAARTECPAVNYRTSREGYHRARERARQKMEVTELGFATVQLNAPQCPRKVTLVSEFKTNKRGTVRYRIRISTGEVLQRRVDTQREREGVWSARDLVDVTIADTADRKYMIETVDTPGASTWETVTVRCRGGGRGNRGGEIKFK